MWCQKSTNHYSMVIIITETDGKILPNDLLLDEII